MKAEEYKNLGDVMSSQKNILKNLITNALVSSSMATCMLTTGSAFASGSPALNRTASGVAANLFTGVGLDSGVAFNPATSVLTIDNVDVSTGGINNIPAIFSLNPQTLNVDNNLTLGAIGGARLNLNITGDYLITWNGNGVSATAGTNTKDQAGNASPFGPANGPYGLADNTFSVGNMNFNNNAATFDIYTTNKGSIIDQNTVFQQPGSATLSVTNIIPDNGTTILHPSVTQFETLQINGTVTARLLPNIAGDFNAYPANLNVVFNPLANGDTNIIDARFGIGNSDNTGGVGVPRSYNADPGHTITSGTDGYGLVAFNSGPNGQERIVNINVGTNSGQRLGQVTIEDIQANETGIITVNGTMFAKTILLATNYNAGNGIIWTSEINTGDQGVVEIDDQSVVLFQNNIISDISFISKNATIVTMDDGFNVTGDIYKTNTATGAATLNFAGNSLVTGDIGGNSVESSPIDVLNIQSDNTKQVMLKGNVTVNDFDFNKNGIAIVGGTLTATGVNFNNLAGVLEFNGVTGGANPANYTFSSPVVNQAAAQVTVATNLIVTDPSIANIGSLVIGEVVDGALTMTIPGAALVLNSILDIQTVNSELVIAIPAAQTVTFNENVTNTTGAQGGSVTFDGTNGGLVLAGNKVIGAGNNLNAINIKGAVDVLAPLNVGKTNSLNVQGGAIFTDNSITSSTVANINIGDGNGAGTYVLTPTANFNLATANMKFNNANSTLNIQSNGNVTATINGNLDPGAVGSGIITLSATGGNTLTLDGAGLSLGVLGGNTLNNMTFSGAGNITVVPTINTANAISTGIAGNLILGNVNADIDFTNTTNLTVSNVTGAINLGTNAGTLNVANGSIITGTIDGSGTINFGAGTEVTDAVGSNSVITLADFNAGGNVTLDSTSNATNFSIGNNTNVIAGALMTGAVNFAAGAGTLVLQNGLNGAITTAAPNNGIVTINGGNVTGTITDVALVNIGVIPVTFSANVSSTTVALTNNASILTVGNNVTLTSAVTTANPNNGILILNPNSSSVIGNIGTNLAPINAVQVGAGSASLQGDVYAGAVALTNGLSSLTLNVGTNVNGAITNTSGNNNSGILIFNGGSITGAAGAPGAALSSVTFNANGNLPVASYAQNFNVNNAAVVNAPNGVTGNVLVNSGTYNGDIDGNASFGGVGTIKATTITGQTDFVGNGGTVNINDGGNIGIVTSSAAAAGNLTFAGGANVNGAVSNINAITLDGIAGNTVNFTQNVTAASLAFTDGATANLQGSLTTTGNVDFNDAAGILQFSGPPIAGGYSLKSPVANAGNATLNVLANLTAYDSTIGDIKTITIGNNAQAQTFTVDVSAKGLNLLEPLDSTVNFGNAGSVFALTTSANQAVTFYNSFEGNNGTVNLSSTSNALPNKNVLLLQGKVGNETLGTAASPLGLINVSGNVGVVGTNAKLGTQGLDVRNTAVLSIAAGGVFADESLTSAKINSIKIGDANAGPATYALDAINTDFNLQAKGVSFENPDSVFKLMTSAATANTTSTITLDYDIEPPAAHKGIVELNAKNKGVTLKIGGAFSLGTKALPLKQITFSGDGLIEVDAIATDTIDISVPQLVIGVVNADVLYSGNTNLGVVQINGKLDFQDNAGTVVFASDTKNNIPAAITGSITSTGGVNGTVIAMDDLTVGGSVTNIAMFKGGADGSIVKFNTGGDMSATEIQGTGTGTAVDLVFPMGGSISGDVGTANNPIGTITAQAGTLILEGKVTGTTAFMIDGATIQFNDDINIGIEKLITPNALMAPMALAAAPIDARFNSPNPEIAPRNVGTAEVAVSIAINGNDVTFTNDLIISQIFTLPRLKPLLLLFNHKML